MLQEGFGEGAPVWDPRWIWGSHAEVLGRCLLGERGKRGEVKTGGFGMLSGQSLLPGLAFGGSALDVLPRSTGEM